ncbi:MAG: hypothetical protein VX589_12960 [Myxococcota bacterium]|nr:hypothetical protein [Myxococcota bacterium]
MHQLRDAVLANDAEKILARCSSKTRALLTEMLKLARAQSTAFRQSYPPEFALGARGVYPPGLLTAQSELALFTALIQSRANALNRSDGLRYGLSASGHPVILGGTATVATKAGESIEFVQEGGAWFTKVFEPVLARNLERFQLNQRTLEENLKAIAISKAKGSKAASKY